MHGGNDFKFKSHDGQVVVSFEKAPFANHSSLVADLW